MTKKKHFNFSFIQMTRDKTLKYRFINKLQKGIENIVP